MLHHHQGNLSDDNDESTDEPAVTYTEMDDVDDTSQLESKPIPIIVSNGILNYNKIASCKQVHFPVL